MSDRREQREPGPDHPITIEPCHEHVTVSAGPTIIAATTQPLCLREADYPLVYYVPRDNVATAMLEKSDHTSWCPYKGEATYYHVDTGLKQLENAVWSYEAPFEAVSPIAGTMAFYGDRLELEAEQATPPPSQAGTILEFWFGEIEPKQRFMRDDKVDGQIRERFGDLQAEAASGTLDGWEDTPRGALALLILLDQFSRNLHRDAAEAFLNDPAALSIARHAIACGHDLTVAGDRRAFFYMPFMHSEKIQAQEDGVRLFAQRLPGTDYLAYAKEHRDIIAEFGRFPHRNDVLGRETTAAEHKFLDEGGATFS